MMGRTGLQTTANKKKLNGDTVPNFNTAYNTADELDKDQTSFHKPGNSKCNCSKTTPKGAYRDVTAYMDDMVVHYYHQHPVVAIHENGDLRLDSCGFKTRSTKGRINRYLPDGYKVYQEDHDWYVETPRGEVREFEDGMKITVKERAANKL